MSRKFLVSVELPGDPVAPLQAATKGYVDARVGVPGPHAATHAIGGADPVTPDSIGAATPGRAVAMALIMGG